MAEKTKIWFDNLPKGAPKQIVELSNRARSALTENKVGEYQRLSGIYKIYLENFYEQTSGEQEKIGMEAITNAMMGTEPGIKIKPGILKDEKDKKPSTFLQGLKKILLPRVWGPTVKGKKKGFGES